MMEQEDGKASRRPRSDSLRNRERLLAAAREVFSTGGADASLEAVARTAGLGIGTLYRHFPTREALFNAVYRREVDQLVELGERLMGDPRPVEALRRWLHANVDTIATKKGMLAALAPAPDSARELYADSAQRLIRAVGALMQRAVAAEELRGDITPEDLMHALVGMCYARQRTDWRETVIRLVDVFVDGLRRSS
jgi:AcrR family transcriptional regulator